MAGRRRHFGSVRKLSSGRYQVRYLGPDGLFRPAPSTFARKADAELWLTKTEADLARDDWFDPSGGRIPLRDYATTWLQERTGLSETTRERYDSALRLQILPGLGSLSLREIQDPTVRRWRKGLIDAGTGEPSIAKAYRLLRAILNTAVDDGLIRRNPCRIKGASAEASPERPILTVAEVLTVAEAIPARFRALVLMATFTGLRFGELAALRRLDVDTINAVVHVRRAQVELSDGRLLIKSPKTAAGLRSVSIPEAILPDVIQHLRRYAERGVEGRVFVGSLGAPLRRQNFRRIWVKAVSDASLAPVHFHDLRHTGNTLAAGTGASLRELMARMGHASTRAALIYQHATSERDRVIADALSGVIEAQRQTSSDRETPTVAAPVSEIWHADGTTATSAG